MTLQYLHSRGKVVKILPDDIEGSRHQKFILKLADNSTVLVVHNIDLCQRLKHLSIGDEVEFYGVYKWNHCGGLVHWTHKNIHAGYIKHRDGWLKHQGRLYQ